MSAPKDDPILARRRAVRDALAHAITRFELDDADADSDEARFTGEATFAPALVGPPGRLHGGLHAYARLFPILARVPRHDDAKTFPCRVALTLRKAILLDERVPFRGRYARSDEGFSLDVVHHDTDRLHAKLEGVREVVPPLDAFREALARCDGAEPDGRILAAGDLPTTIHRALVVMAADRDARTRCASLASYLTESGDVDPAMICVLLDVAAAVVIGWDIKGRAYTVKMALTLVEGSVPADVDLVALADRRTRDDDTLGIAPVTIGDRTIGPRAVDVLLADAALTRAYAYGTVTLVPVRRDPA